MGFEMSKPHLRAELEADLKRYVQLYSHVSFSLYTVVPNVLVG